MQGRPLTRVSGRQACRSAWTEASLTAKVSVILPTFNRSHSLKAAINSVLTQSYRDIELIVVDDGSSEDIEGLVRTIGDRRLRYVRRTENGGAAAARNTGLAVAGGDYIGFQDSDDIWLPHKLERQLALFSSLPKKIGVVTGAKILYGRDEAHNYGPGKVAYAPSPKGRLRLDEDQLARLLTENRVSLQNALFRKDCFSGRAWFDTCARANEDWEFAIRLVQQTVIYEDVEPVVLGFISADSISSNSRKQTMGLLRILNNSKSVLASNRKIRSIFMIDVGVYLYRSGKRKTARKFVAAGITDYPPHVVWVGLGLLKKFASAIFRKRAGEAG